MNDFIRIRIQKAAQFVLLLSTLSGVCAPTAAFAGVVIVPPGEEVRIPVSSKTGSLLQLPFSVKAVTPAQSFEIADVASEVDAVTGAKVDVRLFQVRPLPGAQPELVTFVLGNGKTVKTQLLPSEQAEKHYDIVLPGDSKKPRAQRFLQAEIALMSALLRDDSTSFARQSLDSSVTVMGLEKASAVLKRIFVANGLKGFVFEMRNKSSDARTIDASQLGFGSSLPGGNQVALIHVERERIEPCGLLLPSPECKTNVFVVARSEMPTPRQISTTDFANQPRPPFVRQDSVQVGGAQ